MAPLPARDIQSEVDFTDYTIGRVAGAVNGQLGGKCQDRAFRLVTLPFASECLIRRTPFGRDGGRARCVLSFSGRPLTLASSYFSSLKNKRDAVKITSLFLVFCPEAYAPAFSAGTPAAWHSFLEIIFPVTFSIVFQPFALGRLQKRLPGISMENLLSFDTNKWLFAGLCPHHLCLPGKSHLFEKVREVQ